MVMGRIRIRITVGVIDCIYVVWSEKSIVKKVLVLVLAILFAKHWYWYGNTFYKYC